MDLERVRSAIDGALEAVLDSSLDGAPDSIGAPIRYAVLAPGKRLRPLLVVASHDALAAGQARRNGRRPAVLRLACGVELVHAYSLVHDDLPCMDDDELRRGRPTAHVRFGVRDAILAGAALMPLAVEVVASAASDLGLDETAAARLTGILTSASGGGGMVGGQLRDLAAEGRDVAVDELERIHEGKTARLIEAACLMGAVAAGGSDDDVARLGRYGRSLGLAFQVVDDILDVTGTATSMGKAGGRDVALGKATYPDVLGLETARRRARALVDAALTEVSPLEGADGLARLARVVVEREH